MHNTACYKGDWFRPIFGPSSDLCTRTHATDCPKMVTFITNCVVHDGTALDTFIDLTTAGLCDLKTEYVYCAVRTEFKT
jgi:hypothetical protein